MIPFFAIFLIPAWFALVDGRLSNDEGPIIGVGWVRRRALVFPADQNCQNLVIRAFRWLQLYPSCLPVSTKLFSCGVRFYSLVARRFRLKHRSRIQGHDLSSLEVLAEVRSSLCFASNEILSVSLCLCRCICININIARLESDTSHQMCI